jgi:hypothetical protein
MWLLERRVGGLEAYINAQVRERVEAELEAALDLLKDRLGRDEYERVLEIFGEELDARWQE